MIKMNRTKTPKEWYHEHVDRGKLFDSIIMSMVEAVREGSLDNEGDAYMGLVDDIINSSHGQFIPVLALEYFDYDIDTENPEQYDFEEVLNELDSFTAELEDIINDNIIKGTNIEVRFGHWESDGTFCLMCFITKEDYKANKERYEAFMSGKDFFNPFEN